MKQTTEIHADLSVVRDRELLHISSYIQGEWQLNSEADKVAVINPATNSTIATITAASAKDAVAAVSAAQQTFPAWSALLPQQRVDARLDQAVAEAIKAKFATSGQDCLAANRFFIERAVYDEFCQRFSEYTRQLKVGSGIDDPDIGSLINSAAAAKQQRHIADAVSKGAKLLCGGVGHEPGSLFFSPAVLVNVPLEARIFN